MFNIEAVITEKCNLRCPYCYMHNNPINMTIETFNSLINSLDKLLGLYSQEHYNLSFFGGEPLINWSLIEEAILVLDRDYRCNSYNIISNLLLLDDHKVQFIKNNKINVSFSFDGLWNEFNRPLADGSSSLKSYEEKRDIIKEISPYGCKVMVSPSSLGTLVENAKYLVEFWGFNNPDYSLVRDDIWSKEDINKFRKEIRQLSDLQIDYINKNIPVMIGFYRLYILDMIFGKKYGKRPFGCFAGNRGIACMPDGIIYPCARFGTNKEYPLYNINTKYLYTYNYNLFIEEKNINPQKYDKCKNCSLYNYCNAGCLYSQLKNNFEPLDSICELFDILYNECFYVFDNLKNSILFLDLLKSGINN